MPTAFWNEKLDDWYDGRQIQVVVDEDDIRATLLRDKTIKELLPEIIIDKR